MVWADIPVTDMDRARAFYGAVLRAEIESMEGGGGTAALLPGEGDEASADPAPGEEMRPSTDWCTIYLDAGGDPEGVMTRAVAAAGEILMRVADMGEMIGFIGAFEEECVWQRNLASFFDARAAVASWIRWYIERRPHQALG